MDPMKIFNVNNSVMEILYKLKTTTKYNNRVDTLGTFFDSLSAVNDDEMINFTKLGYDYHNQTWAQYRTCSGIHRCPRTEQKTKIYVDLIRDLNVCPSKDLDGKITYLLLLCDDPGYNVHLIMISFPIKLASYGGRTSDCKGRGCRFTTLHPIAFSTAWCVSCYGSINCQDEGYEKNKNDRGNEMLKWYTQKIAPPIIDSQIIINRAITEGTFYINVYENFYQMYKKDVFGVCTTLLRSINVAKSDLENAQKTFNKTIETILNNVKNFPVLKDMVNSDLQSYEDLQKALSVIVTTKKEMVESSKNSEPFVVHMSSTEHDNHNENNNNDFKSEKNIKKRIHNDYRGNINSSEDELDTTNSNEKNHKKKQKENSSDDEDNDDSKDEDSENESTVSKINDTDAANNDQLKISQFDAFNITQTIMSCLQTTSTKNFRDMEDIGQENDIKRQKLLEKDKEEIDSLATLLKETI